MSSTSPSLAPSDTVGGCALDFITNRETDTDNITREGGEQVGPGRARSSVNVVARAYSSLSILKLTERAVPMGNERARPGYLVGLVCSEGLTTDGGL
jgi:hypothetical protein